MLKSGEPDFPFCLCWANEDWTRAWDGRSGEVLVGQKYSDADDIRHLHYLLNFFEDTRYIRIDDRPLFLVYRANRMPDARRTTDTWRSVARKLGIGELYLCRVESFPDEHSDPTLLGFDAAIEFQPDWQRLPSELKTPAFGSHRVYDYATVVGDMIQNRRQPTNAFPVLFRHGITRRAEKQMPLFFLIPHQRCINAGSNMPSKRPKSFLLLSSWYL